MLYIKLKEKTRLSHGVGCLTIVMRYKQGLKHRS